MVGGGEQGGVEDLDGDGAAEAQVGGEVDGGEAAARERAVEAVAAVEDVTWAEHGAGLLVGS